MFTVNKNDEKILVHSKSAKGNEKLLMEFKVTDSRILNDRIYITMIGFSGWHTSVKVGINSMDIYELNRAEDLNLEYKDSQLTMATINDVIYKYNRHATNDSTLNVLINQDQIASYSEKINQRTDYIVRETADLTEYMNDKNLTKYLDNDQEYKEGFRNLVVK